MSSLRRVPVRWRLAVAFTAAAAVVLLALGLFLHQRLRHELDGSLDTSLRQRAGDLVALTRDGASRLGTAGLVEPGDHLAQVLDGAGRVVAGAPGFERAPLLTRAQLASARRGPLTVEQDVGSDDGPARLLAAPAGERVVVVGALLEDRDEALANLDGLLAVGLPAALLLSALAGFLVAGGALRPIDRMRSRADAIGSGDLAQRLPVPEADDELRALATTLNAMLARLEEAFARERAFVADASHELRTPLANLKAELELAGREGRTREELAAAVTSAAEETERLARLADDLLVLARADAGRLPVRREAVRVGDVLDRVAARAGDARVAVEGDTGLVVDADPLRLEQALGNLLDNALRHGAAPVVLRAAAEGDDVVLHVLDAGPGLPAELDGRAFDRFTRGDAARARGGAGLGLAIVDAIARGHGGAAGIAALDGRGTDAWLRLPG